MSDDQLRMIFGFVMLIALVVLVVLAGVIALGKVEEHTSFGLQYVLGALATMAGGFVQWAFGAKKDKE